MEALVRRLEPALVSRLRREGLAPDVAGELLEDIVTLLLYRWEEIAQPDAWLLELLELRLQRLDPDRGEDEAGGKPR